MLRYCSHGRPFEMKCQACVDEAIERHEGMLALALWPFLGLPAVLFLASRLSHSDKPQRSESTG